MSWRDWADTAQRIGESGLQLGENALEATEAVPGIGNVLNVAEAGAHVGEAIYDGATGDRDGAVGHLGHAAVNAVGIIPGANTAIGAANGVMGQGNGVLRLGLHAAGQHELANQVPTTVGDLAEQGAVGLAHAIGGNDDSNWIAHGNTPTGTRQEELMAGAIGANAPAFPLAPGPVALTTLAETGGVAAATHLADQAGLGGSNRPGTTSGVHPEMTWGARAGNWVHEQLTGAPVRRQAEH